MMVLSDVKEGLKGIVGVTDSSSCGVQVAGENEKRDDGVDTGELSDWVYCDSSVSVIGEMCPVKGS